MKFFASLLLVINCLAMWYELGRLLNPALPREIRKQSALWLAIVACCFLVNLSIASR